MTTPRDTGIPLPGYHERYYGDRDWKAYSGILARIVEHSRPGPILDLGAGCGYLVEAANHWGLSSIGLEGSASAVAMARKRGGEDLDIRQHRLSESLPFDANTFQTVVLNQVAEHLEPATLLHTLSETCRVLRPGGMLLITSPSRFNKAEWKADPTHINLLSPSQLHGLLVQAGYVAIEPFDLPLPIFGNTRWGLGLANAMFKLFRIERLSATANAMAFKPGTR